MERTKFLFQRADEFIRVLNALKETCFVFVVRENEIEIFGQPAGDLVREVLEENRIEFIVA